MSRSPLVSVIMPLYNTTRYVAKAVKSILGQTYRNLESLVADGGPQTIHCQSSSAMLPATRGSVHA